MEKSLILLRGLPGSGKSTMAHLFDCPVFEADQFFIKDGEYQFDHNLLPDAHEWCKTQVENLMKVDTPKIAVANTFIEEFEITSYYMLAELYNYKVFTAFVENRHGGKNVHGVSDEMMERMRYKLEANKRTIVNCETTLKFNKEELDGYVADDLLSVQKHPTLDLYIYNYTKQAEYLRWWNPISLQCRGLVLNSEGEVIARPFKKFFNFEDVMHKIDLSVSKKKYEIYDKLDGSLGMLFWYKNCWVFSSRGSFNSSQAREGFKFLGKYNYMKLDKEFTYMFEIIYPTNKICVDYGGLSDIILLGAIHTESGIEMTYNKMLENPAGFNVVHKNQDLVGMTLTQLKNLDLDNREGYVVKVGDVRVKVKFSNYFRKHAIMTNVSSYDIWENLKSGKTVADLVKKVDIPDEFYEWIQSVEDKILLELENITVRHQEEYEKLKHLTNKKDFAMAVLANQNPEIFSGYLFSLNEGRDIRETILNRLKPEYELPFSNNAE
jgi:hypothetical protein